MGGGLHLSPLGGRGRHPRLSVAKPRRPGEGDSPRVPSVWRVPLTRPPSRRRATLGGRPLPASGERWSPLHRCASTTKEDALTKETVMDIQGLGYVGIRAKSLEDWTSFGTKFLGMQLVDKSAKSLALRMDDRKQRVVVAEDGGEGVGFFGW